MTSFGNHAEFHEMPDREVIPGHAEEQGAGEELDIRRREADEIGRHGAEEKEDERHRPPAEPVGPDAEVEPGQRTREDRRGGEPFHLGGREMELLADLDPEHAQHQPDIE